MQNSDRRRFVINSSLLMGALATASACKTRGFNTKSGAKSQGPDLAPPSNPLVSNQGYAVRYPLIPSKNTPNPAVERDVRNLMLVYGQVFRIMCSAISEDQVAATSPPETPVSVTPGTFERCLPERVADGTWQNFTWWNQAKIHLESCPHGDENFVFWHRPYLFYFEKIVRTIARNIVKNADAAKAYGLYESNLFVHRDYYLNWTLPYFNWDPTQPLHPLFFDITVFPPYPDHPEMGTGNVRTIDANSTPMRQNPSDFVDVSKETIDHILNLQSIYSFAGEENFSSLLEGAPHGGIHVWVGGQMQAFFSPLDPIFWTHHGMIDFLFEEWMTCRRNEGQTSKHFLPDTIAETSQRGFFDVETGQPATMSNADIVEQSAVRTTYFGLTPRKEGTPQTTAVSLSLTDTLPKISAVVVDDFVKGFIETSEVVGEQNVSIMRAKLKVSEDTQTQRDALELLNQILKDLKLEKPKHINTVQLRFENLGVAIADPQNSTLSIRMRKSAEKPFLETRFAKFDMFGSKATPAGKKRVEGRSNAMHPEHHRAPKSLLVDLVPLIKKRSSKIDFQKLLTEDIFTVDFMLAERRKSGEDERTTFKNAFRTDGTPNSRQVKITLSISQRSLS